MVGAGTRHDVSNCDSDKLGDRQAHVFGAETGHDVINRDSDNFGGKINSRVLSSDWT